MSGVLMFYQEQQNFPHDSSPFTPLYQGSTVLFARVSAIPCFVLRAFFPTTACIYSKKTQHTSALGVPGSSKR